MSEVMSDVSATKPTLLELLLLGMGWAGICLSMIVAFIILGSSIFFLDEGLGLITGFLCGVVGITAGVGLIALSYILKYLRIIAAGTGPGKVFE